MRKVRASYYRHINFAQLVVKPCALSVKRPVTGLPFVQVDIRKPSNHLNFIDPVNAGNVLFNSATLVEAIGSW